MYVLYNPFLQADLGEEVRDQHQQLVAQLLPDGGKLKFSKLLLRQPDEAGAGTTPEFFVMEQVGGAPGVRLELKQLLGWWKGGQEQHCVTGAWDEDSTTAGGDQDAHAPGTSVPAAAIEQDAIAVQPTAVYAPAQAAAELAVAAMGLEPMGVGTKPAASTGGAPIPQTSNQNTHVAGVQEQEMGNHGAGGTGTVSPVHGASDTTAQEEQLAAAAAWPGEGPQAQLRRAAAALLLQRRTWGPQGPHSLQQVGGGRAPTGARDRRAPRARRLLQPAALCPECPLRLPQASGPAVQGRLAPFAKARMHNPYTSLAVTRVGAYSPTCLS